jgi:ribosomal protein S18 acetylase RimI-like enzyme
VTYQRNVPEYTREQALALGHPTAVLGPSQISFADVAGHADQAYLLNWITDPAYRGYGYGAQLMWAVCRYADYTGVTLITHPDDERLKATMEGFGFEVDPHRQTWEAKPLMVRVPAPYPDDMEPPTIRLVNA